MAKGDMGQKVRIYYPGGGPRNYFCKLTAIGPAFGKTQATTPIMTRAEALNVVEKFPWTCDWELEEVED